MKFLSYSLLIAGVVSLASCLKEDPAHAEGEQALEANLWVVRGTYKGSPMPLSSSTLSGAKNTYGVVVSDAASKNVAPGTFVLQSDLITPSQLGNITRGIVVDLGGASVPYEIGDSLLINIEGATLDRVNGKLTISGITESKITLLKSNAVYTVRPVTLSMIANDFEGYESTVVSLHADLKDYSSGATFSGEHTLFDNSGADMLLLTRTDAGFAGDAIPQDAGFKGIVTLEGEKKGIALRTAADVDFISGALYSGYPESFEFPDFSVKGSYNMTAINNDVDLSTGNWKLQQAILGSTVLRDKFNFPGKQCVRMQQNLSSAGYVQMNFDVTEGASKVTLFYGKYYTDPTSTFKLEYSTNGGSTWTQTGADVKDMPDYGSKQAVFMVNITGNVRFRVYKVGLGTSTASKPNGRLCIEDIAIYKAL
ncbi:DUF5689 domain-containing protein [Pseudoflavitalea rhizosphaerae]|uniref:DUF5689 domain-containing protein n=1 Tax=Pseudoflavitalea rhizosphaerae TaxID=1884793 RepID=UPI000F8DEA11|nr:DUF5689 domain-containing protein [Pseudoflavitalea rhizosphaerae]